MAISFHVYATPPETVVVTLWTDGSRVGMDARLTPEEARNLIGQLSAAVYRLPRVGTAADLGCEVL